MGFLKIPPSTPFLGPPQVGFLDEALPVGVRAPNFVRGLPRGKKKKEKKKKRGGIFKNLLVFFEGARRRTRGAAVRTSPRLCKPKWVNLKLL